MMKKRHRLDSHSVCQWYYDSECPDDRQMEGWRESSCAVRARLTFRGRSKIYKWKVFVEARQKILPVVGGFRLKEGKPTDTHQ